MKSVLVAITGLAAFAAAQSLPQCAQTCANNMVAADKSEELGCDTGDLSCLCVNQNFVYGIRDCSAAICNREDAAKAVQYGIEICKNAGVQITTSSGANGGSAGSTKTESAESTGSGSESGSGNSASLTTIYTVVSESGSAISSPIATSTLGGSDDESGTASVSTFTETGTTTGKTTLSKPSGTVSAVVTTYTTDGSQVVETLTTVTGTGSESETQSGEDSTSTETSGSGESGSEASGTATSTDNAGMPQKTAVPAGVLAAAGLAVFLL